MEPIDKRHLELAEKWLNGTITPAEAEEYARWYNSLGEGDVLEVPDDWAADSEAHRVKILKQINAKKDRVIRLHRRKYRLAAAAAILIFLGAALLFLQIQKRNDEPVVTKGPVPGRQIDIAPGTNGAILTLSNGQRIVLDTAADGSLFHLAGANILKAAGSVSFLTSEEAKMLGAEYNTLVTPRGRQQQLSLADGTKVWLNAESSIRFPTAFTQAKREVSITGEAYFEVAKNALQPFIVHVKDASIEVLGTHFNVMAYDNEPALETTLLEGSVRFSEEGKSLLLKPGEQSRLLENQDLKLVNNADVELAVAWKNGMQAFRSADIRTIMRQVERWYDVDVEFSGNIPSRTFSGEIPRNANLSGLLKLFEATGINFSIDAERKKLTVKP